MSLSDKTKEAKAPALMGGNFVHDIFRSHDQDTATTKSIPHLWMNTVDIWLTERKLILKMLFLYYKIPDIVTLM